jgi:fatty-acyl-CoA synthase
MNLIEKPIGMAFEELVGKYSGQNVLVVPEQNVRWNWKELNVSCQPKPNELDISQERVDQFAIGLLSLGFQKGDRFGVWMPNNSEWLISSLATAKIGSSSNI